MSTDRPAACGLRPRLSKLTQRIAVVSVLVASLALPATNASARPFCDPHQVTPCHPTKTPVPWPPPPPPPPPPVQLISNGSFEQQDAQGFSALGGWTFPPLTCTYPLAPVGCTFTAAEIASNTPWDANAGLPIVHHCGTHSLHVDAPSAGGPSATQRVTIPSWANALSLDFWVLFPRTTLSGGGTWPEDDYLYVALGGTNVATPVYADSNAATRDTWIHVGPLMLDAAAFRGRTVNLDLKVQAINVLNGYGAFVDDVSLQAATISGAIPAPGC